MNRLEEYYNKFNENKRLDSRHGRVEFTVTMKYIHEYLNEFGAGAKVADIGAGTGRYSIPLADEGYDVTAVEPVRYNLGILKKNSDKVKAFQGNALKLGRLVSDSFDLTLLFGPMYHLLTHGEKLTALLEAKRITRPGGIIMVAYCMNEYSVITYAFKEKHILECFDDGKLDEAFSVTPKDDLYDYVRTEEIERLNAEAGLTRIKIISPDGPANYMRQALNALSEEEFEQFIRYQLATCERQDLIGAGAHTVDILRK